MAAYSLDISCSPYNQYEKRNIRVQIKCLKQGDSTIDTAVFAYRYIDDEYIFDHVCSTVDMQEYPLYPSTASGESFKWCRRDTVDIIVRALSIAEDFIFNVKSDVKLLYLNMLAHNTLVGEEVFNIGEEYHITVNKNSDWTEIVTTIPLEYTYVIHQPTTPQGEVVVTADAIRKIKYKPKPGLYGLDSFSVIFTNAEGVSTSYTYDVTILDTGNCNYTQSKTYTLGASADITYTDATTTDPEVEAITAWITAGTADIEMYDAKTTRGGIVNKKSKTVLTYTPPVTFNNPDYSDDFDYRVFDGSHYATVHCNLNTTSNTNG